MTDIGKYCFLVDIYHSHCKGLDYKDQCLKSAKLGVNIISLHNLSFEIVRFD